MKSHRFFFWSLVAPGSVFLVVFLVLPLMSIIVFSFWRTESYQLYSDWNLDNYRVLLTNPSYATFLIRSLVMATVVSAISLVVAWPAAFFITRYGGQFKIILLLLTSTPFLTGEILRVTAM